MRIVDARSWSFPTKAAVVLAASSLSTLCAAAGAGVNHWTQIGPEGGYLCALVAAPSDPAILYAAGATLFRSESSGDAWQAVGTSVAEVGCSVKVDATDPLRLYSVGAHGFGRSTDGGATWTVANEGLPEPPWPGVISVDLHDANFLVLVGEGGYFRSRDRGESWDEFATPPNASIRSIVVDPAVAGRLWALSAAAGVYISADQGDHWSLLRADLPAVTSFAQLIFDPSDSRRIYLATSSGSFRSEDGGAQWAMIQPPSPNFTVSPSSTLYAIWSDLGSLFYRSDDFGETWEYVPPGPFPSTPVPRAVSLLATGGDIFGWGTYLRRSRNGGLSWEAADAGLYGTDVLDFSLDRQASERLYAIPSLFSFPGLGQQDYHRSTDRGRAWELSSIPVSTTISALFDLEVDPNDSSRLLAAGNTTRPGFTLPALFSSLDGGQTWSTQPAPAGCLRFLDLVVDPLRSTRLFWVTTLFVTGHCPAPPTCSTFRSDDSGSTWTCVGYELYPSLAPSPYTRGELLKVSFGGIFRSVTSGEEWEEVAIPPEIPGGGGSQHAPAYFVDVQWASPTTAYASNLGAGLFASHDGGQTWAATGGLPNDLLFPWLTELAVDPFHPQRVFALAKPDYDSHYAFTVVSSSDGGATWRALDEGLQGWTLTELQVDPTTPNRLYVSAAGGGILAYDVQIPEPCVPSATALCITDGRFRLESLWRDFAGRSGVGQAVPLAADTGAFWFFDPDNLELFAKEIDGTSYNDAFWTFYGALSNVEFTLLATDTETGAQHGYFNPSGRFASQGDILSFPQEESVVSPLGFGAASVAPLRPRTAPARSANACEPNATTLCLADGRFAASVTWRDFAGRTGVGTPLVLTPDTGSFWFFDAGIHELAVKVIDGRGTNDAYWVFYGSLSNVEFELIVIDTETGEVWTRENPLGTFASNGDIEAFPQ